MSFQLAYPEGVRVPRTVEKNLAAAQAFEAGALLVADGSDNWAECGANPASIGGIAIAPAGTDTSGFNRFAKREFPPGKMQAIAPGPTVFFTARYLGSLPGANGASYGVVRDTDLFWKVNFADTTNLRVKLLDRRTNSPENIARVVVSILAANVQVV